MDGNEMDEIVDKSRRPKFFGEPQSPDKPPAPAKVAGKPPATTADDPVARDKVPAEPQAPETVPSGSPSPDETPEKRTEPRRRSTDGFVIGFIILALLGYGAYRVLAPSAQHQAKGAHAGGAPQSVGVATIGTGNVRIIFSGLGTVTPLATV